MERLKLLAELTFDMNNLPIKQKNYSYLVFAVIYFPVLALFAFTFLVSVSTDIPIGFFLRDPTVTLKGHPLTGLQSNLGVLVWGAAAAICLFGSAVLKRAAGGGNLASFFFWSGAITAVLMLDDFFLFHDDLAIQYLKLDEKIVLFGYFLAVALYFARFRKIILGSNFTLLFTAIVFFSLSISIDFILEKWESPWRIFLEDGFKLLGIVSWSSYFILSCFDKLQSLPFDFREESIFPAGKTKKTAIGLK